MNKGKQLKLNKALTDNAFAALNERQ
jgi:hypothetical protein